MMKKKYETPNMHTVLLQGHGHLLGYSVNEYNSVGETTVGDTEE